MSEKPVIWLGDSRDRIRAFPVDVRMIAGFQLWRVQRGLEPNDWKPLDLARQRLRSLINRRTQRKG